MLRPTQTVWIFQKKLQPSCKFDGCEFGHDSFGIFLSGNHGGNHIQQRLKKFPGLATLYLPRECPDIGLPAGSASDGLPGWAGQPGSAPRSQYAAASPDFALIPSDISFSNY